MCESVIETLGVDEGRHRTYSCGRREGRARRACGQDGIFGASTDAAPKRSTDEVAPRVELVRIGNVHVVWVMCWGHLKSSLTTGSTILPVVAV